MNDIDLFFNAKSVAIVGASREPEKIGHVILKNFVENFKGEVYPINLNAGEILGKKCYPRVSDIPHAVDLAVIAVPAEIVPPVLQDCADKGIRAAVIISGGFGEIGRKDLEDKVARIAKKGKMRIIGPNCLGIFDAHSQIDTLFLPRFKLERPREGGISFISQSGAVGSVVLDWAASEGFGVSKFISYGNALDINEVDLLNYLADDKRTKVICMYLEGTKDGRKLMETAKRVACIKPIIVIKGGKTEQGAGAVRSHTGSLAGSDLVYDAAFKQSGIIRAEGLIEMFDFARVLAEEFAPRGNKIQIITNGGGFGVMAADAIVGEGLQLPQLGKETADKVKAFVPKYAVVANPLDLVGDADEQRYKVALEACAADKNVDMILCIVLFQTTNVQSSIVDVITDFSKKRLKPMVIFCAGGSFTKVHTKMLEKNGVPCFDTPTRAARALRCLSEYGDILRGICHIKL